MVRVSVCRSAFAMAVVVMCAASHAASLQISPVTVDMSPDTNAAGITLRNPGDQPLYGQVRVFRWEQNEKEDKLEPTQDLVASPPLIQVAPHGEQLVRIVRQSRGMAAAEQSFRVLIDEIPPPEAAAASGVTIRLRYSVPVFVHAAGAVGKPELAWQLLRDPQGWMLRATNTGNRHGQIGEVTLVARNRTYTLSKGLLGYVLAGHSQQWKVDLDTHASLQGTLTLKARVNGQASDAPVAVSASQ